MNRNVCPKVVLVVTCIAIPMLAIVSAMCLVQRDSEIASHEMALCHVSLPTNCDNNFNTYTSTINVNVTVNKCEPTPVVMKFDGLCPQYRYSDPLSYKGRYYYVNTVYKCYLNNDNKCIWDEDILIRSKIGPLTDMYIFSATLASMFLVVIMPVSMYKVCQENKAYHRSYELA
ncbi:Transmembrane domain-containing protein [Orpheovirus IHUMI-LCC2]|uniref:Transmembrane domain-containing protein n=1 Tax=Orpheovirus IHUMI-LCC2 TaxID=2023057 RepID=A0A2I2L4D5_9VIRU|nr:Transmembrane domain-containing protein [Orpheovirus IHUMI-LCC2]SNW62415.1 Transmembrane domain-containing protein [Orpheovirus IHUMI-LCC2]